MMRESLDPWPFVYGVYAVGLIGLALLIIWSYRAMRRAEKRREELKRK
ncbi:heme exporter protein CcmD [uncultured Erythrobacter sp.]|nr:heme exporter protein CcmD [uncultured Erythrobacter sp.]